MAEGNIYEKLRKVQIELKAPKSQRNTFGNYNYRNVEDIIEGAKPLLDKYELLLILNDEVVQIGERYYVKATASVTDGGKHDMLHPVSATAYAREEDTKKGMDGAQITGAASSYARKYALNGLLAIDDTKDADSDEHASQTRQTAPRAATRPAVGGTEELATDIQRRQIKAFMTALGVDEADIPAVLASDYGVKGKLTKSEAVRVLKELQ